MCIEFLKKIPQLLIFISATIAFSQDAPVRLIEDLQKKRTILYVQNDTDTSKSVFLKINPTGYRKSAQRPIIKNIPAKSKTQMLILIPLRDVSSSYTYDLIVNDELKNLETTKTDK
ncbi:hypothetical protein GCM10022393_00130 [Aquimarina addita]|uniref:Uncharacterized protein n=1 Tax=Aquimarina addita TaxID=870485 RepID=A0ABP7X7S7_9FLAO